jgi:8-oxo-dGTP pyrophosphatase MutT (NUDIX family)
MAETRKRIRKAGAVVIRPGHPPRVLLVRALNNPACLVFPQGRIEEGETAERAAARELTEEGGVAGRPVGKAVERTCRFKNSIHHVRYIPLAFTAIEGSGEPGRSPSWYTIKEAFSLLSFSHEREALKTLLPSLPGVRVDLKD